MFNMSNELIEKSYTFQFKNTSLDSLALNPLEILSRQNYVGKLTFLLLPLNLKIYFPLRNKLLLSALQCKLNQNFWFTLLKLILIFFSGAPKLPLIPISSPNIKNLFLRLSTLDAELLLTPNITTIFPSNFHGNYTPTYIYHYFLLY